MEDFGASEGALHVLADVVRADVLLKFGLAHQTSGLFARAAENQAAAGTVDDVRKLLQRLQACGVDGGHIAQAKNQDGRQL